MRVAIDHIFILVSAGGPEGDPLLSAGLIEGPPNTHPGQGTACRRFPCGNIYLELLWVENPAEAQSELVRPTYLFDRWIHRNDGACPFGFVFRPASNAVGCEPPFSSWQYRPPFLPPDLNLAVGNNAHLRAEPMLFFLTIDRQQRRFLSNGRPGLSRASCVGPRVAEPSPELRSVMDAGLVSFEDGPGHRLDIRVEGEIQRARADLRPALPLTIQ